MVGQAAVALLALLREAVAAGGGVEEGGGAVAQAVVHAVLEGQGKVLKGAGGEKRNICF